MGNLFLLDHQLYAEVCGVKSLEVDIFYKVMFLCALYNTFTVDLEFYLVSGQDYFYLWRYEQ